MGQGSPFNSGIDTVNVAVVCLVSDVGFVVKAGKDGLGSTSTENDDTGDGVVSSRSEPSACVCRYWKRKVWVRFTSGGGTIPAADSTACMHVSAGTATPLCQHRNVHGVTIPADATFNATPAAGSYAVAGSGDNSDGVGRSSSGDTSHVNCAGGDA